MNEIIAFQNIIREIYFTYQDAIRGFELINSENQKIIEERMKVTPPPLAVGAIEIRSTADDSSNTDNSWLLSRNNHEILAANKHNGNSYIMMGQMAICTIYNYWEDYYRNKFALALCYENKNQLENELFFNLCLLRNAITHNQGIATEKMKKMTNFKYFSKGDPIIITTQIFHEIINTLLIQLERIKNDIIEKQA